MFALGAGEHGDGVAAVVFVEALGWAVGSTYAGVHGGHHGVVVVVWVELVRVSGDVWRRWRNGADHDDGRVS